MYLLIKEQEVLSGSPHLHLIQRFSEIKNIDSRVWNVLQCLHWKWLLHASLPLPLNSSFLVSAHQIGPRIWPQKSDSHSSDMFSLEFVIRIKRIFSDSCVTKTCMCMLREVEMQPHIWTWRKGNHSAEVTRWTTYSMKACRSVSIRKWLHFLVVYIFIFLYVNYQHWKLCK